MEQGIRKKQVGDRVEQYALIRSSVRGIASNNKPFLTVMLSDKSGEIEAKLWGVTPEDEVQYQARTLVYVQGEVVDFKGRLQLKVRSIRPSNEHDHVQVADFVKSAPLTQEELLANIHAYIFAIENSKLQRITRHLVKKHQEAFLTSPAATKNHHEFLSGLAYHVNCMLDLGDALVKLYPHVNADLLYAGIILHDLGKVRELSGPIDTAYTLEGKLIGHISLMATEIDKAAEELGIEGEEPLMLQHLILSHHGKGEWGSPKAPQVKEAELLHYIDNVDARMEMLKEALGPVSPGQFSERVQAMEFRQFYKPSFIPEDNEDDS
ncbi:3'-5' exoribonuclease [Salsuginibacillus halophilus]|uniref:3'-5' exoribonuclease n=1 Tax=Salsuginibacillus halophilus TaxID=517424 RepID=A0A2P8HG52_9BACI|nr:3'-5' exoribonuclease YhaM [Salsuginibacillus halophilus]PSL45164.1 3'-5' exoribonuclease [Salsuginibacillus halophilus]